MNDRRREAIVYLAGRGYHPRVIAAALRLPLVSVQAVITSAVRRGERFPDPLPEPQTPGDLARVAERARVDLQSWERRQRRPWTARELFLVEYLATRGIPARLIAEVLGRSAATVRARISELRDRGVVIPAGPADTAQDEALRREAFALAREASGVFREVARVRAEKPEPMRDGEVAAVIRRMLDAGQVEMAMGFYQAHRTWRAWNGKRAIDLAEVAV